MIEKLYLFISNLNGFIWGPPMITLIFALGIYLTIKLKFPQKYLFKGIKLSIRADKGKGEVSSFGSLAVIVAATVGTGSIIGVSTALSEGGPGAIFWMIVAGIFCFTIKYAECLLAIKYRKHLKSGEYVGGPMYVIRDVLKQKKVAVIFAVSTLAMSLTAGSALQSNSIADALRDGYNINPWYAAIFVTIMTALVILGGIKRIVSFSEWLVPIMGGLYLFAALIIGCMNYEKIPGMISAIFTQAFTGKAALGGAMGVSIIGLVKAMVSAITPGMTRAVLATESGLGSAPIMAAAAQTNSPVRQAVVSSTSVFWTIIICTISGVVFYLAGDLENTSLYGFPLCNSAFKTIPFIGTPILVFSLVMFSFTTIIGWCYYGEKVLQFLEGDSWIKPFRFVFLIVIFAGTVLGANFDWGFFMTAENAAHFSGGNTTRFMWALVIFCMSFMTVINIYSIIRLRNDIAGETFKHIEKDVINK
ncbi:AGCS family alanine or glycine:cation symporter [Elusimicrobium posterum]|uniref:alanine/glycine:cation symporter family protein n=1 Tax=Elusimicrobium posterum TaxID=3116653 RepID=UPI003C7368DC